MTFQCILLAHQYFQSPRVEGARLINTSHKCFLQMLNGSQTLDRSNAAGRLSEIHIQNELLALLHTNRNNVALMAIQGFFAVMLGWNVS